MAEHGTFIRRGEQPSGGAIVVSVPGQTSAARASVCGLKAFLIDERRLFRQENGEAVAIDCAKVALVDIQDSPVHEHAHTLEIYHIIEGTATMVLGATVAPVGPGDLILIPPGTPHGLSSNDSGKSVRVLISFTPGMAPIEQWEFRDERILHPSSAERALEIHRAVGPSTQRPGMSVVTGVSGMP